MQIINLDSSRENIQKVVAFFLSWNNNEPSILQSTSGSTGKPKLINIPKWKMEASAKMTGDFLNLKEMKTSLICMNSDFIGGKMMIVRSILYDLDMIVTDVVSNPLKHIDFQIDFAAMVPLQVEEILNQNPDKLNLIGTLIIGGAPVSNELIERLKSTSCRVYSTFGMTETVSHIALKNLKDKKEPYRVIGDTSLSIEDDCLVINSQSLELEHLKTNDIVKLIDNKSFYWKGRADFVINSGGVKIHPEEVEEKIKNQLKIDNFIISSISDQHLGQKVIFIGKENLKEIILKHDLKSILTKYEIPKDYFFIPQLIKTSSGKIDRIKTTKAIQ